MLPLRRLPPLPLPRGPSPRRLLLAAASAAAAASPLPWPGLHAWRRAPPSHLRTWGPNGPCASDADEAAGVLPEADAAGSSLVEMGALVLSTADPLAKARLTHAAFSRWAAGLPVGQAAASDHPTRPDKPLVVTQKEIITHNDMGMPLNAYMLHNLAHVELNAIDLAWDLRSGKGRGMASSRISLARPMTRAATFGGTRSGLLSLGSVMVVICRFTIFFGGSVQGRQAMFLHDWQ